MSDQREKIGSEMPDGTIYVGISASNGKALYTTPKDGPLKLNWHKATEYAHSLNMYGHTDWRLPTVMDAELLYDNRNTIGNFKLPKNKATSSSGWQKVYYWTSETLGGGYARTWNFFDGKQLNSPLSDEEVFVRVVRG